MYDSPRQGCEGRQRFLHCVPISMGVLAAMGMCSTWTSAPLQIGHLSPIVMSCRSQWGRVQGVAQSFQCQCVGRITLGKDENEQVQNTRPRIAIGSFSWSYQNYPDRLNLINGSAKLSKISFLQANPSSHHPSFW